MIRLIPGKKGSGKTKILIDAIHKAEKDSKGNVVAIQIGSSLNIDIYHKIRLINIEDFKISDYDCTDIFVDGVLRIVGRDYDKVGEMFDRIAAISESTNVVFTISADVDALPESIKKYL